MTADSDTQPDLGAPPDDSSMRGILLNLAAEGFGSQFVPGPAAGVLRCTACGSVSAGREFRIQRERRLEGASDPDDTILVVAAACPVCRTGGTVVLGYGPNASADDADLIVALERHAPA
ncbi:hypothetical protein [Aquihabitans sp. McL0605]|uniref:hypothetical protein n=1 Tax=Aquihabitans sp. McL0605 TaxID=3415671 RepID=UPI003CEB174E